MAHPTHPGMTINQLQERLGELGVVVSNAIEEQHQICDELMNRAQPDQSEVDWSVVRGAVHDTCDENGIGGDKALAASFKTHGLIVAHEPDPSTSTPTV